VTFGVLSGYVSHHLVRAISASRRGAPERAEIAPEAAQKEIQ
jgi:hypothetical protein